MQPPQSIDREPRGTIWVLIQLILLAIIVVLPPDLAGLPVLSGILITIAGLVIGLIGLAFVLLASQALGPNLTVFPRPVADGSLVESGLYGLVRHPIYCGVILAGFGWSILRGSIPSMIVSIVLLCFFDLKARQEEIWLAAQYPQYTDYRRRVRKLIPFVY